MLGTDGAAERTGVQACPAIARAQPTGGSRISGTASRRWSAKPAAAQLAPVVE